MREQHRLRRLDVRVRRHDRVELAPGERDEGPLEAERAPRRARRSRGASQRRRSVATWSLRERPVCSFPRDRPDARVERHLQVQVHVLEVGVPGEACPAATSASSARRPSTSVRGLVGVSSPARSSPRTWAMRAGEVIERELGSTSIDRPKSAASASGAPAEAAAPGLHGRAQTPRRRASPAPASRRPRSAGPSRSGSVQLHAEPWRAASVLSGRPKMRMKPTAAAWSNASSASYVASARS